MYGYTKCEVTATHFFVPLPMNAGIGSKISITHLGRIDGGGRTSSQKRNNGTKQATPEEVYEHGRWRRRMAKENMPTRYNEYGLDDRINLTLLCM
jgi:hypothetical protein